MHDSRAYLDIYELAIRLRFLLVEREALDESGLWVGTVSDATTQLAVLVAQWPREARLVVEYMEDCKPHGVFYADVISTLWSMLARGKGNALLEEMEGAE